MDKKRTVTLATAGLLAVGLMAGGVGWVAAQPPVPGTPGPWTSGPGIHTPGGFGVMGAQHTQMQSTLAEALGLTPEELQAQIQAGKTVPQIAQERGVDLTKLQTTMQAQHQTGGPAMAGPMAGGHGTMAGQHSEMQSAVANALGLTTEEFQAQIEAGKTVPQIAQERGIDLAKIHEAVQAQ